MTVFHKILKIKPTDVKNPYKEIDEYLRKNPGSGIDYIILQNTPAVEVMVVKFICSDKNPGLEKKAEDIDKLIRESGIKVIAELDSHKNDPLTEGKADHDLQIGTNQVDKETEEAKEIERE